MINTVINRINEELTITFDQVNDWFDINNDPKQGGWNVRKILEHISLTNHFLLILISKATRKASELSAKQDNSALLVNYDLDWKKLKEIGEPGSFEWNRPEHMEPTGNADLAAIRNKLHKQVEECRLYLKQLKNGEGALYKTMMTVNGLGKIDVYHYIYFLVQHAKRHLMQIEKIKFEWSGNNK